MSLVTTWMDLEIIILSKPERERQILYGITYVWNINVTQMNVSMKQTQTHRHRAYNCSSQGWGQGIYSLGLEN